MSLIEIVNSQASSGTAVPGSVPGSVPEGASSPPKTMETNTMLNLRRIAAALSICGAHIEYIRVGGNVCLPGGSIARLVGFKDDTTVSCLCFLFLF